MLQRNVACIQIQNVISAAYSKQERSEIQDKIINYQLSRLEDVKVLLCCALLTVVLAEAKNFNLITLRSNISTFKVIDDVEIIIRNSELL